MKLTSRPFYSDSLPWCVCLSRMRFLIFSTSSKFLRPHPLVANRLAGDCEAKRSTIISERRRSMKSMTRLTYSSTVNRWKSDGSLLYSSAMRDWAHFLSGLTYNIRQQKEGYSNWNNLLKYLTLTMLQNNEMPSLRTIARCCCITASHTSVPSSVERPRQGLSSGKDRCKHSRGLYIYRSPQLGSLQREPGPLTTDSTFQRTLRLPSGHHPCG